MVECDDGDFVIQGTTVDGADFGRTADPHESAVRIPRHVLTEAIERLQGRV